MILSYLPYILLLAVSPIVGEYFLRFAYPDVKTLVKGRKWAIFIAFGFLAYVPAAFLTLFEVVMPLYSPFGTTPVLFEYEGNWVLTMGLFFGILIVNASTLDYVVVRQRKTVIVGLPKKVIKYSIGQQIFEKKKVRRANEIAKITKDLEQALKETKDVTPLLEGIRTSVEKSKITRSESETRLFNELEKLKGPTSKSVTEEDSRRLIEGISSIDKYQKSLLATKPVIPKKASTEAKESKAEAQAVPAPKPVPSIIQEAPIKTNELVESAAAPAIDDRERLIAELEAKLRGSKRDSGSRENTEKLMDQLKKRVKEDIDDTSSGRDAYLGEDIDEITKALKGLKGAEPLTENKRHHHGKAETGEMEEGELDLTESLVTYNKAYPSRRGDDDIWKAVVGDVRQQLSAEPSKKEKAFDAKTNRWYEKGSEEKRGEPAPLEFGGLPGAGGDVELFENDLMQGGEGLEGDLGDLEAGLDFGDVSDLEGLTQDVDSGGFDGMFVDVGGTTGGCPNCGKKGTSIVYCSNCGKPLCSNCAKSVEGSEDFIKYQCPHCEEEFAMKRRIPA